MKHSRDEVIERAVGEFERLDGLVAGLSDAAWVLPLPRPETKDPWTVKDALQWHRQVQAEVLQALREAPEAWFSGRERRAEWPYDLDGHSADHRVKDIEAALAPPAGE